MTQGLFKDILEHLKFTRIYGNGVISEQSGDLEARLCKFIEDAPDGLVSKYYSDVDRNKAAKMMSDAMGDK